MIRQNPQITRVILIRPKKRKPIEDSDEELRRLRKVNEQQEGRVQELEEELQAYRELLGEVLDGADGALLPDLRERI
jgi:hypothetical protein